jgi:hypothetical protein
VAQNTSHSRNSKAWMSGVATNERMKVFYGLLQRLLIPDPDPTPTKGRVLVALAIIVSIFVALAH